MRGRKPAGPEVVERLQGSEQAKTRLRVILETLTGSRRVQQACRELGIGEVRFNELRQDLLEGALAALEARPRGRPPRGGSAGAADTQELLGQVESLRRQLEIAQVREEIALARVPVPAEAPAPGGGAGKKTTARESRRKRRRRRSPT